MNTRLLHVKVRVLLHGDSLLGIIRCDVLKYFGLGEWVALFVEASEPQPWCLRIEIICYKRTPVTLGTFVAGCNCIILWLDRHVFSSPLFAIWMSVLHETCNSI